MISIHIMSLYSYKYYVIIFCSIIVVNYYCISLFLSLLVLLLLLYVWSIYYTYMISWGPKHCSTRYIKRLYYQKGVLWAGVFLEALWATLIFPISILYVNPTKDWTVFPRWEKVDVYIIFPGLQLFYLFWSWYIYIYIIISIYIYIHICTNKCAHVWKEVKMYTGGPIDL